MFDNYDEILTVDQLMEILDVGKNTAYKLLNEGNIKAFRIGNKHKIPKQTVIDYIRKSCN